MIDLKWFITQDRNSTNWSETNLSANVFVNWDEFHSSTGSHITSGQQVTRCIFSFKFSLTHTP